MPTVLFKNGYRFYFYTGDRTEPAHVHVEKGDGDGKVWLVPELNPSYLHFKVKEQKEVMKIVEENYDSLKKKWDDYFGE